MFSVMKLAEIVLALRNRDTVLQTIKCKKKTFLFGSLWFACFIPKFLYSVKNEHFQLVCARFLFRSLSFKKTFFLWRNKGFSLHISLYTHFTKHVLFPNTHPRNISRQLHEPTISKRIVRSFSLRFTNTLVRIMTFFGRKKKISLNYVT